MSERSARHFNTFSVLTRGWADGAIGGASTQFQAPRSYGGKSIRNSESRKLSSRTGARGTKAMPGRSELITFHACVLCPMCWHAISLIGHRSPKRNKAVSDVSDVSDVKYNARKKGSPPSGTAATAPRRNFKVYIGPSDTAYKNLSFTSDTTSDADWPHRSQLTPSHG
jgi:hypothetical protein